MTHLRSMPVIAVAAFGCVISPPRAPAPTTPVASVTAPAAASQDLRAPVVIAWVERSTPATPNGSPGRYLLVARVAQPGALGLPLAVQVTVPPGATLARGETRWTVQPAPPGAVQDVELEIFASAPPADDLILIVDAQGPHAGVHAEARYRFGRPEPVGPQPTLAPTPLVIGGRDFGRPVQASP